MNEEKIKSIIKNGENTSVEFKECRSAISKTCYETICGFLNRHGGELLLGVKDNGYVSGIDEKYIERIKKDFINAINNPQKLNPPFYLGIEEVKVDNKSVLYVYVPESSQVHRCNGKIFDRNEDGDYDITNNTNLVSSLYLRKQTSYSENRVYPYVEMSDFRTDLIQQSRKIATIRRNDHPWSKMTDEELIKNSRLFQRDYQTGKEGFTLAAVLLLGKNNVILSIVPHHRTDAILRKIDKDRYDDRDFITTNLIESYDRLMAKDIFRFIAPLNNIQKSTQAITKSKQKFDSQLASGAQSRAQSNRILNCLPVKPYSANELIKALELKSKTGSFKRTIQVLLEETLIEMTIPDKLKSRLQKYRITEKGKTFLSSKTKNKGF